MGLMLVLSPAKRMEVVEGPPYAVTTPRHLDRTALLAEYLRKMSLEECQLLWGVLRPSGQAQPRAAPGAGPLSPDHRCRGEL